MADSQQPEAVDKPRGSGTSSDELGRHRSPKIESHGQDGASSGPAAKSPRPSLWTRITSKLELDLVTVLLMMKGGLPPALALALLQIDLFAFHFKTIGYLVAIIATIGLAMMPRAKFIQTLISDLFFVCIAAAFALLTGYCVTQARAHTSVITAQSAQEYNSSASAVAAIWLFFQVWLANAARAKYPQLQLPVIMYSIFSVVTCINMPRFPTMTAVMAFVQNLLEAFLAGLGCATFVHFFVFPVTVRKIVFKEMAGYMMVLQKCFKAHQAYLRGLEDPAILEQVLVSDRNKDYKPIPQAQALNTVTNALTELHGKLQGDLPFAKREIAIGKLDAPELETIFKRLRRIMLPTIGMTAMSDLIERLATYHGWTQAHLDHGLSEKDRAKRDTVVKDWSDNMKALNGAFDAVLGAACEGLEHAAIQFQLKKAPKMAKPNSDDVEASAVSVQPGDAGFAEYLESVIGRHSSGKKGFLREWCMRHGIEIPANFFENANPADVSMLDETTQKGSEYRQHQRQIYLLLYLDFLLWSCAKAVLALVKYSDEVVASGRLSKSRLILPGWRRVKKWARTFLNTEEGPAEEARADLGDFDQAAALVDLGSAFGKRKDPEHLPPRNFLEKTGDAIRWFPHLLRSEPSSFGFRVAVASMAIGIIAYLRDTQDWFVLHRILWAIIMVAISMTPTAGQSVFSFILRILGTVAAMCASFVCYYIVDKHRAGIIVFLWVFTSMGMWVPLKRPQMAIIGIISVVTNVLILGYTLEVEKIGREVATSNGQEYLPLYEIAPYRLATVVGGLAVAFILTILPYPITEHSQLRQNAGGALYLLANYYSVAHESVQARVKDLEGDPNDKRSLGARLTKVRIKVFSKQMLMLTNLRTHAAFQRFEIPIGGRFPRAQYDVLIASCASLTRYIALLAYASESLTDHSGSDPHHLSQWSQDLKKTLTAVGHTSHEVTSLLSLLSASMSNGQPLPPYMKAPEPFGFARKLESLDPDILSIRHVDEPEYAIFAVFQIASRCIIHELDVLLRTVKELVGELDFSFHVVQTANSSRTLVVDKPADDHKSKGD